MRAGMLRVWAVTAVHRAALVTLSREARALPDHYETRAVAPVLTLLLHVDASPRLRQAVIDLAEAEIDLARTAQSAGLLDDLLTDPHLRTCGCIDRLTATLERA